MTYVSLAWPLVTDALLISVALFFVVRLYLVERRFEEGLISLERDYLNRKPGPDFIPAPGEEWFLAYGCEYREVTPTQRRRLHALRNIARFVVLFVLGIATLFGAGALFAATSTGSLTVSAIVLSRCIIRFPSFDGKMESACSDGVTVTKTISAPQLDKNSAANGAPPATDTTPTSAAPIKTVTLTY